ncbi:hypothetical protein CJF31_00006075 [Rutstroemia sp. NJR-2017a BVV2]|nr:hypothetical protein CJF31_00010201 [Rutstroemia sp. NJR-2017a BVV2]PQE25216.1 hypothetical protein CJF31_00006075 [Rutstroemia sp. NJR-2017a BVV2]
MSSNNYIYMMRAFFSVFLAALLARYVHGKAIDASHIREASKMEITQPPLPRRTYSPEAVRRDPDSESSSNSFVGYKYFVSTCGTYSIESFSLALEVNTRCLVDDSALFFGTCEVAISEATACGWPEVCSDSFGCKLGCGRTNVPNASTLTCNQVGLNNCAFWYLATGSSFYTSLLCSSKTVFSTFTAHAFTITSDTSYTDFSDSPSTSSSSSPSSTTPAGNTFITTVTAVVTPTPAAASNQPSATPSSAGNKGGSSKTAAAVGGAVGGVGAVCIIVAAIFFGGRWLKRYRRKHSPVPTTEPDPDHNPELDGRPMNSELDGGDASRFSKNEVMEKGNDKRGITENRVMSEIDGQTIQEMIHEDRPVELPG